jgi:hypothetical protein
MELKVQSEKVLEAAKFYPDAERVLKTLFPEAFKKDNSVNVDNSFIAAYMTPRSWGYLTGKAVFLNSDFDWTLIWEHGTQVLVPTKKHA